TGVCSEAGIPGRTLLQLQVRLREVLPPLDGAHAGDAPDRPHDLLEVGQVLDFDDEGAGHPAFDGLDLRRADVGPGVRDRRRDLGEEAAAVVALDDEADEEAVARLGLPLDLDPPLRVVAQVEDVGAVGAMDRDPAAAGDVADDAVAGDRLAALGVPHHQVVEPLDADAAAAAPDP